MKRFVRLSQLALAAIVVLSVTSVRGEDEKNTDEKKVEKKTVDPSGTWRWEHEAGGETVKDVLRLNFDGTKVSGTYQGRRDPIEIRNGRMEQDKLSFDFEIEFDGRKIAVKFAGTVKDNDVEGNVEINAGDESREFPWVAKRSVEPSDVVGTWRMHIETPDGNVLTPKLTLTLEGDQQELKGAYEATNADLELDVKEIAVKDNRLSFTVSGDLDGLTITAKYTVEPRGDKLDGTIAFDINGQTGELDVSGQRESDKK